VRHARAESHQSQPRALDGSYCAGAWWDDVDEIAQRRVGLLLQRFPRPRRRTMLAWSRDDDLWKRRAAILCQNAFKAETDLARYVGTRADRLRPLSVREALKNMPRLRGVG
jgi:DNA alkylation repair enzyme